MNIQSSNKTTNREGIKPDSKVTSLFYSITDVLETITFICVLQLKWLIKIHKYWLVLSKVKVQHCAKISSNLFGLYVLFLSKQTFLESFEEVCWAICPLDSSGTKLGSMIKQKRMNLSGQAFDAFFFLIDMVSKYISLQISSLIFLKMYCMFLKRQPQRMETIERLEHCGISLL